MPIEEMELQTAVYLRPNLDKVRSVLQKGSSHKELDDKDDDKGNRTAIMAAGRGNGVGGEEFGTMLRLIWQRYKDLSCDLKRVLTETDDNHKWTLLMHSARCGHKKNLEIVLGFYDEVFGNLHKIWKQVDLSYADQQVKKLLEERVLGIEARNSCLIGQRRRADGNGPDKKKLRLARTTKNRDSRNEQEEIMAIVKTEPSAHAAVDTPAAANVSDAKPKATNAAVSNAIDPPPSIEMETLNGIPPVAILPHEHNTLEERSNNENPNPVGTAIGFLSILERNVGTGTHNEESIMSRLDRLEMSVFERGISNTSVQVRIKDLADFLGLKLPNKLV